MSHFETSLTPPPLMPILLKYPPMPPVAFLGLGPRAKVAAIHQTLFWGSHMLREQRAGSEAPAKCCAWSRGHAQNFKCNGIFMKKYFWSQINKKYFQGSLAQNDQRDEPGAPHKMLCLEPRPCTMQQSPNIAKGSGTDGSGSV